MFESLADHIKEDEKVTTSRLLMKWAAVGVVALALFGGLYMAVRLLQ